MLVDYLAIAKKIILQNIDRQKFDVFLFGSRADGTARKISDIDIGVYGNEKLDSITKARLEMLFEESIIPFKVDVVDFNTISDMIKTNALSHVIYWNKVKQEN
jgi:predicted nucleotidyltransferase